MISLEDSYFVDQQPFRPPVRRYRKTADELPQSLRFAQLNPKLAGFIKEPKSGDDANNQTEEEVVSSVKENILPDISTSFNTIRNQLLSGFVADFDVTRQSILDSKASSPTLLEELAKLLPLVKQSKKKLQYPRSLEQNLQSTYKDLIYDAKYVKREWQVLENQLKHDAELLERLNKEKGGGDTSIRKRGDGASDSDGEMSVIDAAGLNVPRPKMHSRRRRRHIQSQPAATIEEEPGRQKLGTPSRKSRHGSAPRKSVTAPGFKPSLGVVGGDDMSEASHSIRSEYIPNHQRHFEPRARTISAFLSYVPKRHQISKNRANVTDVTAAATKAVIKFQRSIANFSKYPPGSVYLGGGWLYYRDGGVPSPLNRNYLSGHPSAPQPYSMQVLAFNLSNYHSLENKGCHVFGIDSDSNNDHPLEWVVKRLNRSMTSIKTQHDEMEKAHCTEQPYVKYYTDTTDKTSAKPSSDKLGIYSTVMKGGKPKIPSLKSKTNKGQVLCSQTTDGTKSIFYETGELAVTSSFHGDKGFYTLVYDKESANRQLLASFTPTGAGCCYTTKNTPSLLVTDDGCLVTQDEDNIEYWRWPSDANSKLASPICITLNTHMSIKVVSQNSVTLTFQSGNHVIKLPIGLIPGATRNDPTPIAILKMSDQMNYTSNAATDIIQKTKHLKQTQGDKQGSIHNLKRGKNRDVRTPKKEDKDSNPTNNPSAADLTDTAAFIHDSTKIEKDFHRIKNKAHSLVDEWLDTYRIALGMTSPEIKHMKPTDWIRNLPSAKSLPPHAQDDNADELATTPLPELKEEHNRQTRVPSAPGAFNLARLGAVLHPPSEDTISELMVPRLSAREKSSSNTIYSKASSVARTSLPTQNNRTTGLGDVPEPTPSFMTPRIGFTSEYAMASHYQCPIALRHQILGGVNSSPHICKCQRRRLPYITDVELDVFINHIVPSKQLIVISIMSSLYPDRDEGGEMLDRLHAERNANRTHICMQARGDMHRVLRYDIATAYFDTDHTQPLLLSRHNAVAGMFLIFQSGKLIFCDHIFNGYGNAKKDFQKQLIDCRNQAHRGFSLPNDFKFTPQTGKQGPRSPWGGQIGGAGVDKKGNPGTSSKMPDIRQKDGASSPDSVSTLEYHIGKNLDSTANEDVHTTKTLVNRLTTRYRRVVVPDATPTVG